MKSYCNEGVDLRLHHFRYWAFPGLCALFHTVSLCFPTATGLPVTTVGEARLQLQANQRQADADDLTLETNTDLIQPQFHQTVHKRVGDGTHVFSKNSL